MLTMLDHQLAMTNLRYLIPKKTPMSDSHVVDEASTKLIYEPTSTSSRTVQHHTNGTPFQAMTEVKPDLRSSIWKKLQKQAELICWFMNFTDEYLPKLNGQ